MLHVSLLFAETTTCPIKIAIFVGIPHVLPQLFVNCRNTWQPCVIVESSYIPNLSISNHIKSPFFMGVSKLNPPLPAAIHPSSVSVPWRQRHDLRLLGGAGGVEHQGQLVTSGILLVDHNGPNDDSNNWKVAVSLPAIFPECLMKWPSLCQNRSCKNLCFIVMKRTMTIEWSLEVKLPTIWTDGKAEVRRVREEKSRREKIREEKNWEERRRRRAKR